MGLRKEGEGLSTKNVGKRVKWVNYCSEYWQEVIQ